MHLDTVYRIIRADDNAILARMIRRVFEEHNAPRKGTVYSDPTTDDLSDLSVKPALFRSWI